MTTMTLPTNAITKALELIAADRKYSSKQSICYCWDDTGRIRWLRIYISRSSEKTYLLILHELTNLYGNVQQKFIGLGAIVWSVFKIISAPILDILLPMYHNDERQMWSHIKLLPVVFRPAPTSPIAFSPTPHLPSLPPTTSPPLLECQF